MQLKIKLIAIVLTVGLVAWFAVNWFIDYQRKSKASAAPPTVMLNVADAKQVVPGSQFDLIFAVNPNSTPFYSFNITFSFNPTKVALADNENLEANIERLSDDIIITKRTISATDNTIQVQGLKQNSPFIGGDPINIAKITFVMNSEATLPLDFKWKDATTLDVAPIEKKDLLYNGELTPTPIPTGIGAVGVPTATPKPATGGGGVQPTATPVPIRCGNLLCPSGQTCLTFPQPTCTPQGICGEAPAPKCSGTGAIPIDPITGEPIGSFGGGAGGGKKPVMGAAGPVAQTTKIFHRTDRLYINSLTTYPAPFRYEQTMKLEKGEYSLVVGARVFVQRGAGMVIGIICDEPTCGSKKKNEFMYVSPRFPEKAEYSEMREKFSIPGDADNKQYMLRVFCEDGSECDIDYIQLEDAWGSDRVKNPQFAEVDTTNNLRIQPQSWEFDETANLYGSIDPAGGKNGALVINNSAQ